MAVEKPKSKQLLRPITTGANSAMNQSQLLTIICNLLKAREKLRVHGAIGFGFASHWLKNWREAFKPITKRSNRSHVITLDSHLKTALIAGKANHTRPGKLYFCYDIRLFIELLSCTICQTTRCLHFWTSIIYFLFFFGQMPLTSNENNAGVITRRTARTNAFCFSRFCFSGFVPAIKEKTQLLNYSFVIH